MSRRGPFRDLTGLRVLVGYYLLTPLFALVDLAGWAPIRVAGLERPEARLGYYAGIFTLGLVARRWPRVAPALGITESTVNLFLLILAVLGPLWGLVGDPAATEAVVGRLPARVANLAIGGGALALSISLGVQRLGRGASGGPRP